MPWLHQKKNLLRFVALLWNSVISNNLSNKFMYLYVSIFNLTNCWFKFQYNNKEISIVCYEESFVVTLNEKSTMKLPSNNSPSTFFSAPLLFLCFPSSSQMGAYDLLSMIAPVLNIAREKMGGMVILLVIDDGVYVWNFTVYSSVFKEVTQHLFFHDSHFSEK